MERFCKDLREHAMKTISYEKKEMVPLTMKKMSFMKSKKFVTYANKILILMNLILTKIIKMNLILMKMIKMH